MAQEPLSSIPQTLVTDDTTTTTATSNPSLTRNISSSRLNAKAPEFVPRTGGVSPSGGGQPRLVISPLPPNTPGLIHVYPSPNSPFHPPIHHHHHNHGHGHGQHYQQVNNQNHNPQRVYVQQKDGSGPKMDQDVKTEESTQKIMSQVEYYFSDINLATTDHLMRFISKDPEGYVPISVVVSFKKIKALVNGSAQLATILRNSGKLVVSEDGKKVKRQHPLTEADMEELQSRIVIAENLPEDHCHQNLMKIFSAVGSVKTIRTCQPQASNGGASSASRGAAKADAMLFSNKLHAFVEYETIEFAEKASLELNKEASWRNGLRVRLMRRPAHLKDHGSQAKPPQARGKKAGEDESVHKEDDTSTSEQHTPTEKPLDDSYQQPDVQSHEHVGEDHSNDKEGGQKKGRNRGSGRGKGRGRPQYNQHNNHHNNHLNNHHNNRGTHVATTPSSNSIEHPVIGKQPPGPRMPDGTRGFSMGRGKAVSILIESSIS